MYRKTPNQPVRQLWIVVCRSDLRPSVMLHSVQWQFLTDISRLSISPNFKDQEIQEETSEKNHHCALLYVPEERRSHVLGGGSLKSRVLRRGF